MAAGILGVLGVMPGMPNVAFLALAGAASARPRGTCSSSAHVAGRSAAAAAAPPAPPPRRSELGWDDVQPVDPLGLEVGYRLIPLVDRKQGGELLARIKGVRKKLAEELGFLVPAVHIRDNLELAAQQRTASTLQGVPVGEGEMLAGPRARDQSRAASPRTVERHRRRSDPAFGLEAVWIEPAAGSTRRRSATRWSTPSTVIATHLSQLIQTHAHELLGHEEVQQLLDRLAKTAPKLVEDLMPKALPLGVVVRVLQDLLRRARADPQHAHDCRDAGRARRRTQDPAALRGGRCALRSAAPIVQDIAGYAGELPVITLDPDLEQLLSQAIQTGGAASTAVEPGLAERVHRRWSMVGAAAGDAGRTRRAAASPTLRPWLARLVRQSAPRLAVLSYDEVPDDQKVRMVMRVGR